MFRVPNQTSSTYPAQLQTQCGGVRIHTRCDTLRSTSTTEEADPEFQVGVPSHKITYQRAQQRFRVRVCELQEICPGVECALLPCKTAFRANTRSFTLSLSLSHKVVRVARRGGGLILNQNFDPWEEKLSTP